MNLDYTVIGSRIREFRKEKGWTQERLGMAEILKTTQTVLRTEK